MLRLIYQTKKHPYIAKNTKKITWLSLKKIIEYAVIQTMIVMKNLLVLHSTSHMKKNLSIAKNMPRME